MLTLQLTLTLSMFIKTNIAQQGWARLFSFLLLYNGLWSRYTLASLWSRIHAFPKYEVVAGGMACLQIFSWEHQWS